MTVQMNLVVHFVAHLNENGDLKPLIYDNICILHFKDQNTMHFENMSIKILHISKIHSKHNGYKNIHFSYSFNRNPTEMTFKYDGEIILNTYEIHSPLCWSFLHNCKVCMC